MWRTSAILLSLILLQRPAKSAETMCQSTAFRRLTSELQNEHQCILMEKVQEELSTDRMLRDQHYYDIMSTVGNLERRVIKGFRLAGESGRKRVKGFPALTGVPMCRDCYELYKSGMTVSGVYPIKMYNDHTVNVWCDMDTAQGGWTTIQRRSTGKLNFTRKWNDYAFGFGNVNEEYYLGNENIYQMSFYHNYTLHVELWDWDGNHVYATYEHFHLEDEQNGYRIHVNGYSGTAGDAFNSYHDNMKFSTMDKDNDEWYGNCAKKDQSGWWFRACGFSSLNGVYYSSGKSSIAPGGLITGIVWYHWKKDYSYSLKRTEMKVKPTIAIIVEREEESYRRDEAAKRRSEAEMDEMEDADENTRDKESYRRDEAGNRRAGEPIEHRQRTIEDKISAKRIEDEAQRHRARDTVSQGHLEVRQKHGDDKANHQISGEPDDISHKAPSFVWPPVPDSIRNRSPPRQTSDCRWPPCHEGLMTQAGPSCPYPPCPRG